MPTPITIIIPTKNRPHYLRIALESLRKQTHEDWNAVVIGDGDESAVPVIEELNDDRIFYVQLTKPLENPGAVRMYGLAYATTTPYLAFLDDDDYYEPFALELLCDLLDHDDHCVGAYGFPYHINAAGEMMLGSKLTMVNRQPYSLLTLENWPKHGMPISPPSCAVIRREAFLQVGGFKTTGDVRESAEIFAALAQLGDFRCSGNAVVAYRRHAGNLSKIRNLTAAQWQNTLDKIQGYQAEGRR